MSNKKLKIPFILLVVNILAILAMYAFGAYKDTYEQCTGFAGASSPCAEEYFYGYLYFAYITGALLISIIVINWVAIKSKEEKPKSK